MTPSKEHSFVDQRVSLAMTITLISMSMLFATLILGYAVYRFSSPVWPPMGLERISIGWPLVSTIVAIVASLLLERSKLAWSDDEAPMTLPILAMCCGVAFFGSQWMVWQTLNQSGLVVSSGVFASMLHAFTWIHAGHVAIAQLALVSLFVARNRSHDVKHVWLKWVANFWHFLGIIWIALFFVLFVF